MAKKPKYSIVQSEQLEELITVPFHVIGRSKWLKECIGSEAVTPDCITIVNNSKSLDKAHKFLRSQPILGIDSETGGDNKRDGLDPVSESSRMLIFQVGTPELVYLIEPDLVPEFKDELENPNILKIGQNIIHDFKFTYQKYNITIVKHHYNSKLDKCIAEAYDTMLAEQLITSGLLGVTVGLEAISRRYKPHRLISKAVRKEFIDLRGMLQYRHLYYAARDVFLLFAIRDEQIKIAKKYPGMLDRMEIEFCAIFGTADAELSGVVLADRPIELLVEYQKNRAAKIKDQVIKLFNISMKKLGKTKVYVLPDIQEEFDLGSNSDKLEALTAMGFQLKNVQRETLKELGSEITDLLAEYTECTKVISTYGEGLLKRRSQSTGYFHPVFHQLGSGDIEARKGGAGATTIATGRYASDAQQFPRPKHIEALLEGELAELVNHPDVIAAMKKLEVAEIKS